MKDREYNEFVRRYEEGVSDDDMHEKIKNYMRKNHTSYTEGWQAVCDEIKRNYHTYLEVRGVR